MASSVESVEIDAPRDSQSLLSKSNDPKTSKRWSTFQILLAVMIAIIVAGIASNMDRIVESVESNSNKDDSTSSYTFGHSSRKYFALDDDYTEFNFGAYGIYTQCIHNKQNKQLNFNKKQTQEMPLMKLWIINKKFD